MRPSSQAHGAGAAKLAACKEPHLMRAGLVCRLLMCVCVCVQARLLACVDEMNASWDYGQIVFAHGSSPYTAERLAANTAAARKGSALAAAAATVPEQYAACWRDGMADVAKKATPPPLAQGCCCEAAPVPAAPQGAELVGR